MDLKGMLVGIQTSQPFYEKPDGYHLGAEHDQIWLYATDTPMDATAVQGMIEAGWFQEGIDRDGDFEVKHYDANESWTCYT